MSRPKKKITNDIPKFTETDINTALELVHKEYFMQVISLLSHRDTTDLNYIRVPITTPDGGTYLVSILHVDGPKLNLKKLNDAVSEVLK